MARNVSKDIVFVIRGGFKRILRKYFKGRLRAVVLYEQRVFVNVNGYTYPRVVRS